MRLKNNILDGRHDVESYLRQPGGITKKLVTRHKGNSKVFGCCVKAMSSTVMKGDGSRICAQLD